MTRHVRNYWIQARIDGRQTELAGGPRGHAGGFTETIFIRDHGQVTEAVTLVGYMSRDGRLHLRAIARDGQRISIVRDR